MNQVPDGDGAPESTIERALRGGRAAIARAVLGSASPYAAAEARARARRFPGADDHAARLAFWRSRQPGGFPKHGDDRYRWELLSRRCPSEEAVPSAQPWRAFRQDLPRDPDKLEQALSLPLAVAEGLEYLLELESDADPTLAAEARALFDEAHPVARRDYAGFVLGRHPWMDTFALWCLTRCPRTLERLHPLAVALATVYASDAEQGVRGLQFPFAGVTLASASAHVARAVWTVGVEATGLPTLVAAARRGQRPDGGFGDGAQPSDVLTTVACAELLGRVDPGFDLEAPARWLAAQQGGDGLLRVFGPDGAWLTGVAMDLWEDAQRGFSARFLWPQALPAARDRKTGLPFYAWFDDLATTLGALPGLSSAPLELAFLDLAGFRAFNNAYGQALGDRVLQAFAEHLQALPEARVVRDGGDELLVLGAPGRASLRASLDAHRVAWPSRFRAVFGDEAPPVAPRIVVARTVGGALRACREALGRAVGVFKNSVPKVPPEGALDPTDHMLGMP